MFIQINIGKVGHKGSRYGKQYNYNVNINMYDSVYGEGGEQRGDNVNRGSPR